MWLNKCGKQAEAPPCPILGQPLLSLEEATEETRRRDNMTVVPRLLLHPDQLTQRGTHTPANASPGPAVQRILLDSRQMPYSLKGFMQAGSEGRKNGPCMFKATTVESDLSFPSTAGVTVNTVRKQAGWTDVCSGTHRGRSLGSDHSGSL